MKQDRNATLSDNGELGGRRGLMLVLSSPSGAGKTTIARRLLAEDAGLELSVSAIADTDSSSPASSAKSRLAIVVLPAPDGDDSTSIKPRRPPNSPLSDNVALRSCFMVLVLLGFALQPHEII